MERKTKKKVEFILPWPPSINNKYYGTGKRKITKVVGGRVYIKTVSSKFPTKKVKKYIEDCTFEIHRQCKGIPKFFGAVKILREYYPPRKGIWDEGNYLKALDDALKESGVIVDDSTKYLKPLAPVFHTPQKPGHVKITLEEI